MYNWKKTGKCIQSSCWLSSWCFCNFYHPFSRFPDGDGIVKEAKTYDVVKRLDELDQKLDVTATVIFTLIDIKGESRLKQQQPCYFCYDHFLTVAGFLVVA